MKKGGGFIQNYLQFNTEFPRYSTKDIIIGIKLLRELRTEFNSYSTKQKMKKGGRFHTELAAV